VERGRRIVGLLAFALLFVAAGLTARMLVGEEGHVEVGELFLIGGYPVVSALLLLGWLLGRYPIIATLVLFAGIFSGDRIDGYARLYSVRPVSSCAFMVSAHWFCLRCPYAERGAAAAVRCDHAGQLAGPATFVVIVCYMLVYAGLTTLLSLFFRGEA
jgi:hypothetical protein